MHKQYFKLLLFLYLTVPVPVLADGIEFDNTNQFSGMYLGIVNKNISLHIQSKFTNHDPIGMGSGEMVPSLFYRSVFHSFSKSGRGAFGYYFEYGVSPFSIIQREVYDPDLFMDVDPGQSASGWNSYIAVMLGIGGTDAPVTFAVGPGINILHGSGSFSVYYWDGSPLTAESYYVKQFSGGMRLLIEGKAEHFLWGMLLHSIEHDNSEFYRSLSFVNFYISVPM